MTPPTIYALTRGHQDGHVTELFWHPTRYMAECEWSATCSTLLDEAARRAVLKAQAACGGTGTWVGFGEIMDEMIPMIEAAGFVRVRPVERYYYDAIIIRRSTADTGHDDSLPQSVIDIVDPHNLAIERQQWEEYGRIGDEPK